VKYRSPTTTKYKLPNTRAINQALTRKWHSTDELINKLNPQRLKVRHQSTVQKNRKYTTLFQANKTKTRQKSLNSSQQRFDKPKKKKLNYTSLKPDPP
jgi:hypothetical protein